MTSKSSFAIIIPCYNEQAAIPKFKNELTQFYAEFFAKFPNYSLQVIFVNNNSTDDSAQLLREFTLGPNETNVVQVVDCKTQGYGAALKHGFSSVAADWYGFADLDNTYPLKNFLEMIALAEQNNLDIVFTNRLKLKTDMPFIRRLGNLFYSRVAKIIFKNSVFDMCTGMRIFRSTRRNQITNIPSNDLKFSIEFTAIALKQKWPKTELPIFYRERLGPSKLSVIKDGFLFLFVLLRIRFGDHE